MLFHHLSESFLILAFSFIFNTLEELVLILIFDPLFLNLRLKLLNTQLLLQSNVFGLLRPILLDLLNLFIKQLYVLLNLVSVGLLDQ